MVEDEGVLIEEEKRERISRETEGLSPLYLSLIHISPDRGGGSAARLRLGYAPCGGYPAPLGRRPAPDFEVRGGEPEDGKAPETAPCAYVRPGNGVR